MSRNKPNKKITEFEFSFNDISFCNDAKLKPFLETFVQEPENISQQSLGTLFGVFEISDNSEDSSYITNYLISVIKKEYYSKPKRGTVESFEAALHKANLALSKLAEHGNVAWIGKINVLCAALEKYNLHLTQIGSCHAFLLREKSLTDISENLSSPEESLNPLKTFTDISSGKIEENDRLVVTTNDIYDIFSFEEIKKSANKFPGSDFVRFLKTALINELPKAGVLIADIKKKEEKITEPVPDNYQENFNAFSSQSFEKVLSKKEPIEEKLKEEIKEELEKSSREIENVQHGHIYIKEAENLPEEKPPFFSKLLSGFSQTLVEVLNLIWEKTKNLFSGLFLRARSASFKPNFSKIDFRAAASYSKNLATDARNFGSKTNNLLKKFILFIFAVSKKELEKLKLLFQGSKRQAEIPFTFQVEANSSSEPVPTFKNKFNLLPDFGKIKELFSRFSYEQKIYALIILLLIFVVPYIGVKIENKIAARKAALISQNTPQEIVPLEQDKNVVRLPEPETINQEAGNISRIINLNQKIFFVGTSGIFDLDKKQVSPFPSEIGTAKNSAGMNDLNLILLITEDKKVFSFSPISGKYQSNQIEIPIEANPVSGETYLTYLYLLDSHANQIYRYPRAEGGFGTKVNWQKDDTDLSKVSDISVNENIFAVSSDAIIKLFKGKKQDFSVEETATPLSFDKIYVAKNNSEIYILDKKNSRIVRLSPEGNILTQYYSEKIKEASAFSVDEEKNIIYFSVEDKIFSFNIGQ